MAKYYCILFDADNTLLDFDAAEAKALAETLVHYGIEPDSQTVETYRRINAGLWQQLEKGQIRREKLMTERFTRFLKEIGAAGNGAEMNRYYLDRLSTHPDLMPGGVATLAIVTNGFDRVQSRRVKGAGLLDTIEEVFVSEKLDAEKPSRKIFDAALRTLGVENKEHVLMVGDSLSSDIQGGENAGSTPAGPRTPAGSTRPMRSPGWKSSTRSSWSRKSWPVWARKTAAISCDSGPRAIGRGSLRWKS